MTEATLCQMCEKRENGTSQSLEGLEVIERGSKESLDSIQAGNWQRTSVYKCEDCATRWNVKESLTGALFEYEAIFTLDDSE